MWGIGGTRQARFMGPRAGRVKKKQKEGLNWNGYGASGDILADDKDGIVGWLLLQLKYIWL